MESHISDRFTIKAIEYDKYRPSYPLEFINFIKHDILSTRNKIVADIGSGTGLFTKQILPYCKILYGIEPNDEMRRYAEESLSNINKFISLKGTAEKTNLLSNSIDCITVSQAFHWFDKEKCKAEFQRVMKNSDLVLLLWNNRIHNNMGNQFLAEFDKIISEFGYNYENKPTKINIEEIETFFDKGPNLYKCNNPYYLNFDQLLGTLMSSSYIYSLDNQRKMDLILLLQKLFLKYKKNNKVLFMYESILFYGHI